MSTINEVNIDHCIPDFVHEKSVGIDQIDSTSRAAYGVQYQLIESQELISEERIRYERKIMQFTSISGIEHFAQVSARFDPSYQKLIWHRFGIWRKGFFTSQLSRERIEVTRAEPQLDSNLFDRRLSHILIPFDLRVGDHLEYSYSLHGDNPAHGDLYSKIDYLQWAVPVERLYRRYLFSSASAAKAKVLRSDLYKIQTITNQDNLEILIESEKIEALKSEDDLPFGNEQQPFLMISEYPDWQSVAQHISKIFEPNQDKPEIIEKSIEKFALDVRRRSIGSKAVATEIVDFVQNQVRYLGLGGGVFSITPQHPEEVLARRFGDCKDMSRLLVSLLEAADIQALVMLVSTEFIDCLDQLLPGLSAFQHAIVCINIDGQFIWIDPTAAAQYGPLESRYLPNYSKALAVTAEATSLMSIPMQLPPNNILIEELYQVEKFGKLATLKTTLTYQGYYADRFRTFYLNSNHLDFDQFFLRIYKSQYEDIEQRGLARINDEKCRNVFTVNIVYEIRTFPGKSNLGWYTYNILPAHLVEYLTSPAQEVRRYPLELSYPLQVCQKIRLEYARRQNAQKIKPFIQKNEFYDFRTTALIEKFKSCFEFEYSTKCSSIKPEQMESYKQELEKTVKKLGWEFSATNYNINGAIAYLCIFILVLLFKYISSFF